MVVAMICDDLRCEVSARNGTIKRMGISQNQPHEECQETPQLTFAQTEAAFINAGIPWDATQIIPADDNGAALLLSDQCPSTITCVHFDGDTKTSLLDKTSFSGSLPHQTQEALTLLAQYNINGIWPIDALREALINAIIHRDYGYSGPTLIDVFASRVEIVSLGGLVHGLDINDLLNGICQPRNPVLANAYAQLGWSENCGVGIQRMMDAYADGQVCPQLRVGPASVAVVLPAATRRHDTSQPQGSARRYQFPSPIPSADPRSGAPKLDIVNLVPTSAHPTASLETMTLQLLTQSGLPLSRAQIEATLRLSKNQSTTILRNLERQGKVIKQGRSRATRYRLA